MGQRVVWNWGPNAVIVVRSTSLLTEKGDILQTHAVI